LIYELKGRKRQKRAIRRQNKEGRRGEKKAQDGN